jgi:hypothetical protein
MSGGLLTLVITALVVGVIIKRLIGEPLNARELLAAPVVLTGIGVWSVAGAAHGLTALDLGWVTVGGLLGFTLGALRGCCVTIFERDGGLWQRYTAKTFLVGAAGFVVMAGLGFAAVRLGVHDEARPMTLSLGVSFLGEALAIGLRAYGPRARGQRAYGAVAGPEGVRDRVVSPARPSGTPGSGS